jgi:hypothetical protein
MNKKYLSSLNFSSGIYYLKDNGDEVLELYNPAEATQFDSEEDAINFAEQKTSMGEYAQAISCEEAYENWEKFTSPSNVRRNFKKVDPSFSRVYDPSKDSALDVLKMRIKMHENDDNVRFEDYKTWPYLNSVYEHIFNTVFFMDGSMSFSMSISKNKPFEIDKFKEELNVILPFITLKNDEYFKIEIFDHYLSEGGNSCSFFYKNDDDCYIEGKYFDKVGDNLKQCLAYWQRERYY